MGKMMIGGLDKIETARLVKVKNRTEATIEAQKQKAEKIAEAKKEADERYTEFASMDILENKVDDNEKDDEEFR